MEFTNGQRWMWLAVLVVCFAVAPSGEYLNTFIVLFNVLGLKVCSCPRSWLLLRCGDTRVCSTSCSSDPSAISSTQGSQAKAVVKLLFIRFIKYSQSHVVLAVLCHTTSPSRCCRPEMRCLN